MMVLLLPVALLRAVGCFFLLILYLGSALLVSIVGGESTGSRFVSATAGQANRVLIACAGFSFKIEGLEHLEAAKAAAKAENRSMVVITNHISALDMHAVSAAINMPYRPLMKKQVLDIWIYGRIARLLGGIAVAQTQHASLTDTMREYVHRGHDWPLFIMPEGTVSNGSGILRFRTGAFCLDAPLLPVVLSYSIGSGASIALTGPSAMYDLAIAARFFFDPWKTVTVRFLPEVRPRPNGDVRAFADETGTRMAAALGVPYLMQLEGKDGIAYFATLHRRYAKGLSWVPTRAWERTQAAKARAREAATATGDKAGLVIG